MGVGTNGLLGLVFDQRLMEIYIIDIRLCLMVLVIELYLFVPLSVTFTYFMIKSVSNSFTHNEVEGRWRKYIGFTVSMCLDKVKAVSNSFTHKEVKGAGRGMYWNDSVHISGFSPDDSSELLIFL